MVLLFKYRLFNLLISFNYFSLLIKFKRPYSTLINVQRLVKGDNTKPIIYRKQIKIVKGFEGFIEIPFVSKFTFALDLLLNRFKSF